MKDETAATRPLASRRSSYVSLRVSSLTMIKIALVVLGLLATVLSHEAVGKDAPRPYTITAPEKRFLDLVSTLPYTTTSEELKKRFPELSPIKDHGYDNTEAHLEVRLFDLPAAISFSFHKGILVSCGAQIAELDRAQAVGIYAAVRKYFRRHFGKGKEYEGYGNDDANPDYACGSNWTANGIDFGASWKRHGKYQVGWGAQAAQKSAP